MFNSFLLLLRRLKEGKTKAKNGLHSVIYVRYNSKYISVIGNINVQIIGIGYKEINIGRSLILRPLEVSALGLGKKCACNQNSQPAVRN